MPRKLPAVKVYGVATYDSPKESFLAYLKNLNTNKSYLEMRSIRRAHREKEIAFAGDDLLPGLRTHSQGGAYYLTKVQKVIRVNDLSRFDQAFLPLRARLLPGVGVKHHGHPFIRPSY